MVYALTWIPFFTALTLLFVPENRPNRLKGLALLGAGLPFIICLILFFSFDRAAGGYQFRSSLPWIPSLGISYSVGLDGISLTLCLLHALVSFAGAFMSCRTSDRTKPYLFFYLILTGAIYGVFSCLDLFFLYLFYETTLIPLYPMIAVWGSRNKEYGAMKLTLFITAGAVMALFGIIMLYHTAQLQSFDLIALTEKLRSTPLNKNFQVWLAPFILIGFGVIASLWPVHSWSPIGYAAAPTSVSMLHAGVLKKMGPYLILRIAVALLPQGVQHWSHVLAVLSGIGILYAGYAAVRQTDLKFMIGFSSVSHMGYILLGIAAMTPVSLAGAVSLMFSHGVMAAATFAVIGFFYEQTPKRGVLDFGGMGKKVPFLATCFIMASFASLGLPGFSNFVAELMIFVGSWRSFPVIVGLAVFGILITALYLLRTVQHVCYGPLRGSWTELKDASGFFQKFPLVLLLGALMIFGFWPRGLLSLIQPAVASSLGVVP